MQRYFYLDPLAPAWMAKNFGMQFDKNCQSGWENINAGHGACDDIFSVRFGLGEKLSRFYIHPDSLHLLEPKEKDAIIGIDFTGSKSYGEITYNPDKETFEIYWTGLEATPPITKYKGENIIHRNGIPFMWPESEEA